MKNFGRIVLCVAAWKNVEIHEAGNIVAITKN